MDYKYRYLHELQELIRPLKESVRIEIYYDLIKLRDWVLPNLRELELYFNALDFDIDVMLWKFIYKELTFKHHCPTRNERVIQMLKFIKKKKLKIKPFVIMHMPHYQDWYSKKGYYLSVMKIKHYDQRDLYHEIYDDTKSEDLIR